MKNVITHPDIEVGDDTSYDDDAAGGGDVREALCSGSLTQIRRIAP